MKKPWQLYITIVGVCTHHKPGSNTGQIKALSALPATREMWIFGHRKKKALLDHRFG